MVKPPKGASHVWAGLSGATDHPRDRADPLRRQPVAGSGAVAGIERQGIQERRQRGDEGRRDRRQEGRRKEGVVTRSAGRSTASLIPNRGSALFAPREGVMRPLIPVPPHVLALPALV